MTTDPKDTTSPTCSAHEADDAYMGFATKAEIAAFLDELLEAERAVVRKLREMMPKVRDDVLHKDLADMLHSHERNIARATEAREPQASGGRFVE